MGPHIQEGRGVGDSQPGANQRGHQPKASDHRTALMDDRLVPFRLDFLALFHGASHGAIGLVRAQSWLLALT